MPRVSVQFGVSTVVAVLIVSGLYWLVDDILFASVTGLVWGCGLALSIHQYRTDSSISADTTWERNRWVGLGVGIINLAALVGVSPSLPISAEVRLGLGVLVIGTGLVGFAAASLAQRERHE
jgi:hypothetical protein